MATLSNKMQSCRQTFMKEIKKTQQFFFGGESLQKRITGGAKKNKVNGPNANVFVKLRATGVSEFSPFKK